MHTANRSKNDLGSRVSSMLSPDLLRSVLDSAPDAMVIVDACGSIVYANRQVATLFGYEPEELSGRTVECLLPERFRASHAGHRRHYGSQLRARPMGAGLDLSALRKDGTEFPVEISLSPIAAADGVLVAAAIRDISDRRAIQDELGHAREEAERANLAKSRFLATASHDLRQPVQALALLNGAMRRMAVDQDVTEALSEQEHAIHAMSRLLNALLDISKLESGAIRPELADFKVAGLFEELRSEFVGPASNKGLQLRIEPCGGRVYSDPSLVEQAMRNIVSNAIKYTREGHVLLRCSRQEATVRLEVVDTGVGIPAFELARIYDDFYQVGVSANLSRNGYGLGLGIVSRIAKLLGLKLDVRSEVGKGTMFSLEMPASDAFAEQKVVESPASRGPEPDHTMRTHILLVEDDPGVRNATRMLLKVEGHDVSTAASLNEAVKQASEHPDIGLLITDYHLATEETGLQVLSAVRDVLGPGLNALLVTGDTSSAMHAMQEDAHLHTASKPINADELLGLVRELCPAPDQARQL
jgi:PAS domain S-box-containing protein